MIIIMLNTFLSQVKGQNTESEYEIFVKQQINEMIEFQNQQDREFADFLSESWKLYSAVTGIKKPNPGPSNPPVYEQTDKQIDKPKPPIKETIPRKPDPEKEMNVVDPGNINFFGGVYLVNEPNTKVSLDKIDENSIAVAWTVLAKSNYRPFVEECLQLKKKLQLNDWGYIQFVRKAAHYVRTDIHLTPIKL